ncbi:MAG: cryptochrome/photolyase family protein [Chitinophagales bacterium]|nr:cryptochrome/photolyase family protein [Chitinophagales bacterium]MDW8417918.1 cryptochrome/photolyase family protein [Chitinophagales bacterium]
MSEITLVFPHQLFEHNPAIHHNREVVLIEEWLFFHQYSFHCQKLAYHRATMRCYADWLIKSGHRVTYIEATDVRSDVRRFMASLAGSDVRCIHYTDTADDWLQKRIISSARQNNISLISYETPNFICSARYVHEYFAETEKFHLTSFYIAQRKRLNLLLEAGKPAGGRWTYDSENRKKLPARVYVPPLPEVPDDTYTREAWAYVNRYFPQNPGVRNRMLYPIRHATAREWFAQFLKERFTHYGDYQDAISAQQNYLFHAVITPMFNVGLLCPDEVLQMCLAGWREYRIPINALEGFVRQVLGWREFVRAVYILKGVRQRNGNYWNNQRSLPASFYNGTTGIAPVDNTIRKLLNGAYNHHIERLMVLGNFMLLCEIHPNDVYRWFMELYIDAYDWVMVPNVYGMSQFADGGMMSTKPYISSSNYILKMSDYPRGQWCEVWDALYWRFIYLHQDFFANNPRMRVMVARVHDKPEQMKQHLQRAEAFLEQLR